jgi:hypothetical protein
MSQATTELPARRIEMHAASPGKPHESTGTTLRTFIPRFYQIKQLLSGKPLRRPSRPTMGYPSRRQLIERRLPPRSRIQAIIDNRPARDPWLDDEYDWRP